MTMAVSALALATAVPGGVSLGAAWRRGARTPGGALRPGARPRRAQVAYSKASSAEAASSSAVSVTCDNIAGGGKATMVRVSCPDAPRLLSVLTNAVSTLGFNIIEADVTTVDGQVSDEFVIVDSKTSLPATTAQLEKLRVGLTEAAQMPPSGLLRFVDQREAKVWRKMAVEKLSASPTVADVAVQVSIDCSLDNACIVSLIAPDRVGLLRDVTRLFQESNLDIVEATISTPEPGVVRDAFVIRDAEGYRVPQIKQDELVRSLENIAQVK